jgi:AcrR family transcriptional regulator
MESNDRNFRSPKAGDTSTREKILTAAREEFIERGYEGARMQRISDLAGANKAMIYYYFSSKQELYRQVLKSVFLTALTQVRGILVSEGALEDKIRDLVSFYSRLYADPGFRRLLLREIAGDASVLKEVINEAKASLDGMDLPAAAVEKMLREGAVQGKLRELDPEQTIISLIGISAGYFILRPIADTFLGMSPERSKKFSAARENHVVDLFLHGILK